MAPFHSSLMLPWCLLLPLLLLLLLLFEEEEEEEEEEETSTLLLWLAPHWQVQVHPENWLIAAGEVVVVVVVVGVVGAETGEDE